MARKLQRREIILVTVLAIVVISLIWNQTGGIVNEATKSADDKKGAGLRSAPVVLLADLEDSNITVGDTNRDLFSYGVRPPRQAQIDADKARIDAARAAAVEAQKKAPVRVPVKAPVPRPRVAQPPKPQFTFIGIVGPKEGKIAVFEEGQTVMIANIGDVIKEPFFLKKVGFESVVIGYTDERFKDSTTELKMPKDRR